MNLKIEEVNFKFSQQLVRMETLCHYYISNQIFLLIEIFRLLLCKIIETQKQVYTSIGWLFNSTSRKK